MKKTLFTAVTLSFFIISYKATAGNSYIPHLFLSDTGKQASIMIIMATTHRPDSVALFKKNNGGYIVASERRVFTDNMVIPDTLTQPNLYLIKFYYHDWIPKNNMLSLFIMPGENINMELTSNDSLTDYQLSGSKLAMDYRKKLVDPVERDNNQIKEILQKLQVQGADTIRLKSELNTANANCWNIPRQYILSNPGSPLSLIALQMMGNGDPTNSHPIAELDKLFHTLSPEVRNSDNGKAYYEKLSNYLQSSDKKL